MALMPPGGEDVLNTIASVREGVLVLGMDAISTPEDRAAGYDMQLKMRKATTSAERSQIQIAFTKQTMDKAHKQMEAVKQSAQKAVLLQQELAQATNDADKERLSTQIKLLSEHDEDPSAALQHTMGSLHGWLAFASADAPALGLMKQQLQAGACLGFDSASPSADGWTLKKGTDESRLVLNGARFELHGKQLASLATMLPLAERSAAPEADLEASMWTDPGIPGKVPKVCTSMRLTVTDDGIRFASVIGDGLKPLADAQPYPRLDLKRLDAVPENAFLASGFVMHPQTTQTSAMTVAFDSMIDGMLLTLPIEDKTKTAQIVQKVRTAIATIDGNVVAWIEPGVPMPVFTAEIDMPQATADDLIAL
ncbi:MAG: hypothetical protein AAB263_15945, partial [Planctomycetota bacterium]